MPFDPSKPFEKVEDKASDFDPNLPFEKVNNEGPGAFKSLALGAMSGIPGAETALSALRSIDPNTTYEQAHQGFESDKDAAYAAHPVAYGAGKGVGIVGTGAAAALAAPATIPGALIAGAVTGAAAGADEASRPADIMADAAKGGAIGTATGGLLKGAGALASKVLPKVGKAAVSMLGKETSPADVESYLNNPSAINNAPGKEALSENLAGTVGKLGQDTQQMSAQAENLLQPNLPATTADQLKPIFDQLKSKYMTNGAPTTLADKSAINALDQQYKLMVQQANNNGGMVSEPTLKSVIQRLQGQNASAFDNPTVAASKDALKNTSGALNGVLKDSNPAYGEAMKPVAEQTGLMSDVMKKFGLTTDDNGKVIPGDATVGKVMNAIKEGKSESYDMLDHLKDLTGIDYLQKIQDSATASRFNAPGLGFGHLGGIASKAIDGGQVAKSILNQYIGARGVVSNPAVQKYGAILANAAKQGGNQLAATHFVLSTSDPEYQKLANEHQEGALSNDQAPQ